MIIVAGLPASGLSVVTPSVSLGNVSTLGTEKASTGTFSWSHDNNGNMVVVVLSTRNSTATGPATATYGGVAMTTRLHSTPYTSLQYLSLANPPAGLSTVAVTLNTSSATDLFCVSLENASDAWSLPAYSGGESVTVSTTAGVGYLTTAVTRNAADLTMLNADLVTKSSTGSVSCVVGLTAGDGTSKTISAASATNTYGIPIAALT